MSLVNPDYVREVRGDGITYRKRDVIDRINQLVDEQLAGGPVDDYNADRYDKCWHCGRHWHGLPITVRIAAMYARGVFDEDYRVDTDDSLVLCRGSDFIGPMPAENPWSINVITRGASVVRDRSGGDPHWLDRMIATALTYASEMIATALTYAPEIAGFTTIPDDPFYVETP